jgi:hypothetical protein
MWPEVEGFGSINVMEAQMGQAPEVRQATELPKKWSRNSAKLWDARQIENWEFMRRESSSVDPEILQFRKMVEPREIQWCVETDPYAVQVWKVSQELGVTPDEPI